MKDNRGKIGRDLAKQFLGDHFHSYLRGVHPSARTLCGHAELDPIGFGPSAGASVPFVPWGAYDGKVVDSEMANRMSFDAHWGAPCGTPVDADKFLADHPQYDWLQGLLRSRPAEPWTEISKLAKR